MSQLNRLSGNIYIGQLHRIHFEKGDQPVLLGRNPLLVQCVNHPQRTSGCGTLECKLRGQSRYMRSTRTSLREVETSDG